MVLLVKLANKKTHFEKKSHFLRNEHHVLDVFTIENVQFRETPKNCIFFKKMWEMIDFGKTTYFYSFRFYIKFAKHFRL